MSSYNPIESAALPDHNQQDSFIYIPPNLGKELAWPQEIALTLEARSLLAIKMVIRIDA
jgi:hypothetical protein